MDVPRKILLPAGVAAVLIGAIFIDDALRPILRETQLGEIRYAVSFVINLINVLSLAAIIAIFGGKEGRDLPRLSGVKAPIGGPLLFALVIFAPAVTAAAFIAKPDANLDVGGDLVPLAFVFPVFEEIFFRGLAIGSLMRLANWPFVPAALLPAAVFGLVHAYQGDTFAESAGVVAFIGVGGVFYGWLFVRWGFNLWPTIFLHVGLNALWEVFDLGDNAIGGWTGNVLRFGVLAAALLFTLFAVPLLQRPATKAAKSPTPAAGAR